MSRAAIPQWHPAARINFYRSLSSMSNRFPSSSRSSLARLRCLRQGAKQRLQARAAHAQAQDAQAQDAPFQAPLMAGGADASDALSSTHVDLEAGEAKRCAATRASVLRRRGFVRGAVRHGRKRGDWRVLAIRSLGPLFVLALLLATGGRYVRQRLDVENQVRRVLLPQLQKQLGVAIEVGRIESDYLSHVTLYDVVVGRDKRLPLGALLQAENIQLDLDLIAFALGRADVARDPLRALSGVRLQSPQLVLSRDARGVFNFERLLKSSSTASKARWSGRVQVANGRVWFRDQGVRSSRGAILVADARGIDGEAVFNGQSPTRFGARLMSTHVRGATLPRGDSPLVRGAAIEGRVDAAGRWFSTQVKWPQASSALLAQYVFSDGAVVAHSGALGGVARIAWDGALPAKRRLMLRGQLALRDVSGHAASILEPGTRAPLQFDTLSGPLRFDDTSFSSGGLSGRALGSPFFAVGSLVLPQSSEEGEKRLATLPVFQFSLRSDSLDTTRLAGVLRNANLLQGALISGNRARGVARVAGDSGGAQVEAEISVPNFSLRQKQAGNWRSRLLQTRFQLSRDGRSGQATIFAPDFNWNQVQTGLVQGQSLQATTRFRFDPRATIFDAVFKTAAFQARRAASSSRASGLSDISKIGGVASGRESSGTFRFASDARSQNLDADVSAPRFSALLQDVARGMSTHVGRGKTGSDISMRGNTLRAALHLRDDAATPGANWDAIWSVPDFQARGQGGLARAQLLQGRARFGDATIQNSSNRFVRISARNFAARHPRLGWGHGKSLSSLVVFDAKRSKPNALRADVSVTDFAARPAQTFAALPALARLNRLGTLRADSLRVVTASDDVSNGLTWRGAARLEGLDARALDVAALAPQMSGRVRGLGTLNGTARFAQAGGPSPRVEGDFRLSRATVQDVALRDVTGRVSLAQNIVTLSGARARGESGEFLADASLDLGRNTSAISLRTPRIALGAKQLNPLLASLGVAMDGSAVGTVSISNRSASPLVEIASGSSGALGTGVSLRANFDFFLPRATFRARDAQSKSVRLIGARAATAPSALQLAGARIRGAGVLRQGAGGSWRFGGGATFSVARASVARNVSRLANFDVPLWMRGSRFQNLRVTTRGDLTRTEAGLKPDLAGQIQIARAVLFAPAMRPAAAPQRTRATPAAAAALANATKAAKSVVPARAAWALPSQTRDARAIAWSRPATSPGENRVARQITTNRDKEHASTANAAFPRASAPREVALDDVSALFAARGGDWSVPRFSARAPQLAFVATPVGLLPRGDGASKAQETETAARLSGHFELRRGGSISGQLLAQSLSAARLQSLAIGSAARVVGSRATKKASQARRNSRQVAIAKASTTSSSLTVGGTVLADSSAKLRGVVFARVDLAGTLSAPRAAVQARLYHGALEAGGATLPLDAARAEFAFAPLDARLITLRALTIWSRGGLLTASGTLAPAHEYSWSGGIALNLETRLDGVPLERFALVPSLRAALREGDIDGLLSGDGRLSGTLDAPLFEGRASLRLAHGYGVGIEEATTSIRFEQTAVGPRLALGQIAAQSGSSTLSGAFALDAARNSWSAQLQTLGVPTDRLLRALSVAGDSPTTSREVSPTRDTNQNRANALLFGAGGKRVALVPLRGVLRADIDLRGVLQRDENASTNANNANANNANANNANANNENAAATEARTSATTGDSTTSNARVPKNSSSETDASGSAVVRGGSSFALLPREGRVRLATDALRWRGRELGALRADFTVRDGLVQSDLTLASEKATIGDAPTDASQPNAINDSNSNGNGSNSNGNDSNSNGNDSNSNGNDSNSNGNATNASGEREAGSDAETAPRGAAILQVRGALPLNPDERGLDATVSIGGARISLVREALVEAQRALRERGQSVPNFDLVVARLRSMPSIEGRMALEARLAGSWNDPTVALSTHVREARSGKQDLPALDADLSFAQGAIQIRELTLRQSFAAKDDSGASDNFTGDNFIEAKTPKTTARRDERETVLRLAPGGRIAPDGDISLDAEVLNANLSQLALWLPGLRRIDGRPILRGELSLFTFQVRGKTSEPRVVGSIEAQNLIYRDYSLDRLRVARFDIDGGQLRIEPGSLSVVKGGFQSSAAWGRVPWSWGDESDVFGPRRNAPLEVHLPLRTPDFGALAGAFVPALSNVAARSFKGEVQVSGTLDAPQLAGEMTLGDARFRANPAAVPFDFGVSELSGTMRFRDGNRLEISGLRGRLSPAWEVDAPATNNLPAAVRDTRAARRQIVNPNRRAPRLQGEFALRGSIALDLNPDNFVVPGASLAAHRYDLHFALDKGRYSDETYSGLRDVALRVDWKTGQGIARQSQNLQWNLNASGRAPGSNRNKRDRKRDERDGDSTNAAGRLASIARARLAPDFASGTDAFLRSRFDGTISLNAFPFEMRDVARGLLTGTLRLDNQPASPLAPSPLRILEARRLKNETAERFALAPISNNASSNNASSNNASSNNASRLAKMRPANASTANASTSSSPHMSTHAGAGTRSEAANKNRLAPSSNAAHAPSSTTTNARATTANATTANAKAASATNLSSRVQSAAKYSRTTSSAASDSSAAPIQEPPYRVLFSRSPASKATLAQIDNTLGSADTTKTADDATQHSQTQQTALDLKSAKDRANISEQQLTAQKDATASGGNASGGKRAADKSVRASGASAVGSAPSTGAMLAQSNALTNRQTAAGAANAIEDAADAAMGEDAANGDLEAARGGAPLRVSGAIVVSEAEAFGAPVGVVGVASVLPDGPVLDVRLVAGRNVRFMTPTLRAEFIGALDVRGTPRNPNVNGRISTRDGQIRFPNAPARISEGEVAVSVSRDPVTDLIRSRVEIDATARGTVGRYRITIAVKGPLDFGSQSTQNLRVDVTSDPPLSQDEAFAQLTGTSVRDFQNATNGKTRVAAANEAYARAVVSLLSAPLFAGIERSLEEALGLSSITLDYRFSEPLSVQFGKAVGDRVYVTYRRSLSATTPGQPTSYSLRVDYRIKGGLLLGVQTDERGRRQLTLDRTFRF